MKKQAFLAIPFACALNTAYALNNDFTTAYYNNEYCQSVGETAAEAFYALQRYNQESDTEKKKYAKEDRYGEDGVYPTAEAYLFDHGYAEKDGSPATPWYSDKRQDDELSMDVIRFAYNYATTSGGARAYGYNACMNIYGYLVDYYRPADQGDDQGDQDGH